MNSYTFDVVPMGKPRMTQRDKWKHREVVDRYYVYKDELNILAKKLKYEVKATFEIIFCIPMPDSWSQKKQSEMYNAAHQQKPDIDNLLKAFLDCLVEDDSFVHKVTASKVWGKQGYIQVLSL